MIERIILLCLAAVFLSVTTCQAAPTAHDDIKTCYVGTARIDVLAVGWRAHATSILLPLNDAQGAAIKAAYPSGEIYNAQNVMVIRNGDAVVLVDSGLPSTLPRLIALLNDIGIAPAAVTHVIITHAHRDHIGGLTRDGKPVFPKARILFSEEEYAYWNDAANRSKNPNMDKAWGDLLPALSDGRVDLIRLKPDAVTPVLPGIGILPLYGHTPGHCGVLVEDCQKKQPPLLFWGDLLHGALVQIQYPGVTSSFDMDKTQAIATRQASLTLAAEKGWRVFGAHMPDNDAKILRTARDGGFFFKDYP